MKEQPKYHHWEEEITETALDYKPPIGRLRLWFFDFIKKQQKFIDQIMEKKK